MLSGEGNENGEKTTIGLIIQKKQICTCSTLWTFLCYCFARLQSEIPRNFLVTRFMEEMWNVLLFTGAHFYLGGRLAFLIFSPLLQNFHVFLPIKKCLPLFSLSRSSSLSLFFSLGSADLSPTFSFSLCFSLSIFQIQLKYFTRFPFSSLLTL